MSTHCDEPSVWVDGHEWELAYDFTMGHHCDQAVIYVTCIDLGVYFEIETHKWELARPFMQLPLLVSVAADALAAKQNYYRDKKP